ncbi:MAG: uvrC, partial [Bacteroidetes bacterium]|nr:uvrC [Bacteroidota bacterium]
MRNVRGALKAIRDIFPIRSCNYFIDDESIAKRKIKVCLDYHIKKCEGPCEGLVSQVQYNAMINQVAELLKGKTESLIQKMQEEMESLAGAMRFEEAAALRDRIKGLQAYSEKQKAVDLDPLDRDIVAFAAEGDDACGVIFKIRDGKMIGRQHYYMSNVDQKPEAEILETLLKQYYLEADFIPKEVFLSSPIDDIEAMQLWLTEKRGEPVAVTNPLDGEEAKLVRLSKSNHAVKSLQRDLRLGKLPRKIECFDISNIQGTDPVASMVVFEDGKPKKSEYRKFKIRSVEGPDDFASMREVIQRRYQKLLDESEEFPDLIMVDGGKGQLSSAVEVLVALGVSDQPIIGLAKRLEEVFVPGKSDPELIPKTSTGLRLLQQVRDEAHRFAITFHRSLRARRT